MINLLPPQQKSDLRDQKRLRLIFILGILFLSLLAALFLVLFLTKVFVMVDLEEQKIILEEKEKIISLNQKLEKEIVESNNFISSLNSFYENNLDLTQTLEKINETLPSGTYLTKFNISFIKSQKEIRTQITLSGYSPNRDILLKFRANLKQEEGISGVSFSPASWIEPTEIEFSVIFQLVN